MYLSIILIDFFFSFPINIYSHLEVKINFRINWNALTSSFTLICREPTRSRENYELPRKLLIIPHQPLIKSDPDVSNWLM